MGPWHKTETQKSVKGEKGFMGVAVPEQPPGGGNEAKYAASIERVSGARGRERARERGTRAEVEAAQVSNAGKRRTTKKTCFGSLLCCFPPSTVESVCRRDEEKRSRSFPSARRPLPPPPAALWFLLIVTWRPLSIIPAVWRQLIRSSWPFGCRGCGVMEMKTRLGAMLLLIWTLQGKLIYPPHVHRGACSRDW